MSLVAPLSKRYRRRHHVRSRLSLPKDVPEDTRCRRSVLLGWPIECSQCTAWSVNSSSKKRRLSQMGVEIGQLRQL
jgi:hypothetical protein